MVPQLRTMIVHLFDNVCGQRQLMVHFMVDAAAGLLLITVNNDNKIAF